MGKSGEVGSAGWAVGSFMLWVLADGCLKWVARSALPNYEVIGLVGAMGVGLLTGWAALAGGGGVRRLWPREPGRQGARALLDVGNNLCLVVALRHLPLAIFYVAIFLAPLVTSGLAAVWLGERLGWRRLLALVGGLAGVVVSVAPALLRAGRTGDWVGYLACMGCVACFSVNLVWSRVLTHGEQTERLLFASGVVTAAAGVVGVVGWGGVVPAASTLGVLGLAAVLVLLGSWCFFAAVRGSGAAYVSQFHYSQLVAGAALGWLVWGERPTVALCAGGVLIVAAGVYGARVGVGGEDVAELVR